MRNLCPKCKSGYLIPSILILLIVSAGCTKKDSDGGPCADPVNLFPTPVSNATTLFPDNVDDDYLGVAFSEGFAFTFYGTQYDSVYLNTNGGMTFGGGNRDWDLMVDEITLPGIAVFWGDLDAYEYEGETRPNQMRYQVCSDRFIVTYNRLQDHDEESWNNTATVTLYANGRIVIEYGEVLSLDILVGVFNGTHTDDQYMSVQTSYYDYFNTGTGILLYDYWGTDVPYDGGLNGQTITFNPGGSATAASASASRSVPVKPPGEAVRPDPKKKK